MKYFRIVIFLVLGVSFSACGGDSDGPPTTLPTTASITGSVNLYDEGTEKIDGSGMLISASGTSISNLTNDQGSYLLSDVPFGARTLSYEKTGYGTFKYFITDLTDDLFISNTPSLGKISQTKVITCAVIIDGTDVKISSVCDGTNTPKRYLRYFFGTDETINNENYSEVSETYESDSNVNPAIHIITQKELIDLGFASGTQVSVKVYGESTFGNDYEDTSLNRRVFPNLNATSAEHVTFMVP